MASQSAPARSQSTDTSAVPMTPGSQPRCAGFSFAAQTSALADRALQPDEAMLLWLADQLDQEIYGPVTFAKSAQPASAAGALRYDLEQGGEPAGDAEVRRDDDGWFVFSSHVCSRPKNTGTTSSAPSPASAGSTPG